MLDSIVTDMGGRIAEELTFQDITSGAQQDIAHATNLAHAMVCSYGMSEKIGPLKYDDNSEHIYLGRDITKKEACSEETLREIDIEVKRIVTESADRARAILTAHHDMLDKLAEALLERETMSAAEIRELLGLPPSGDEEEKAAPEEKTVELAPASGSAGTSEPADPASSPASES